VDVAMTEAAVAANIRRRVNAFDLFIFSPSIVQIVENQWDNGAALLSHLEICYHAALPCYPQLGCLWSRKPLQFA
jgi:hypothetical protein